MYDVMYIDIPHTYIHIPNASKDYCLNGRCDKGYFLGKDDYLYDFHCTLKSTLFYLRLAAYIYSTYIYTTVYTYACPNTKGIGKNVKHSTRPRP